MVERPGQTQRSADTYDVLLGHFVSGKQAWVARGLANVQGVWLTPDRKLAMVAASKDRGIFSLYDSTTFQRLLERDLAL